MRHKHFYINGILRKMWKFLVKCNFWKRCSIYIVKQGYNLYIGIAREVDKNTGNSGFSSKDKLITANSKPKDTVNKV